MALGDLPIYKWRNEVDFENGLKSNILQKMGLIFYILYVIIKFNLKGAERTY